MNTSLFHHLKKQSIFLSEKDKEIQSIQMYRNKDYQPSSDTIRHVREVFNLLSILTENHNLEDKFNEIHFDRKDGEVNMEAAWQKVMDQNYNEGFSKGEARGISIGEARAETRVRNETLNQLLNQGIITKEQAAKFCNSKMG